MNTDRYSIQYSYFTRYNFYKTKTKMAENLKLSTLSAIKVCLKRFFCKLELQIVETSFQTCSDIHIILINVSQPYEKD